ncbi:Zinc finger-containing ubiquitin peptidase 1 [Psilocybe cubensis]|uniref:UFSP1/2/DUB catalytic domain-containing protein n=2 Tax=Psilocybe cubensis TaxID=181762 RepID=A0A8H8CN62_PSICU|nr:Zinc finger-containing ubiquitin peptidase 1 [Psilocybe cubensis]KAH9484175.1 Zinc finger-containing ubiquitin peptidase 1 [Psilocybe cubensis]
MPHSEPRRTNVDDEIEFQSVRCAICSMNLDALSISHRQLHYDKHLNDLDKQVEGSSSMPIDVDSMSQSRKQYHNRKAISGPVKGKKKPSGPFPCMKESDDFWYAAQANPPPPSFTPGIIPLLRKALVKSHARGQTRKAVLCYENAVHCNREPWDANWGCGYRNFLMACASLMNQTQQPLYFPLLDFPLSPSIRNLQTWIEAAWSEGFDNEGRTELKKLVGTKKWIGTADLWVAFVSRGIPAELVDFDLSSKSKESVSDLVVNWVINYFSLNQLNPKPSNAYESLGISTIATSDKMPIILQHDGHSRTVVGYETDKNGVTSLLVFDPSYKPSSNVREAALAEFSRMCNSAIGQSPTTLKRKYSEIQNDQDLGVEESGQTGTLNPKTPFSPIKNGLFKTGSSANVEGGLDLVAMLKKFRLEPKRLQKKKLYQILYFPMTAPLTDYEKSQLKQVRSTKI